MNKFKSYLIALLPMLFIAVTTFGCSAPEHVAHTVQGLVSCGVDRECKDLDPGPICGDSAGATCHGGICNFGTLSSTPASDCICVDGDIRFCTGGIQTCVASGDTANWGTCTSGYTGLVPPSDCTGATCHGSRDCRGTQDCLDDPYFPMCAATESTSCVEPPETGPKQCIYRLSSEPDCACVERDVRVCTTALSAPGHQTCEVTGSSPNVYGVATGWGTCT